jgi:hypothetical protein
MRAVLWVFGAMMVGFWVTYWILGSAPSSLEPAGFVGVICGVWAFWYAHTGRLARLWRKV